MPHKQKIREIMKETGLTQAELAPKLGVTFAALNRWLGGKAIPRKTAIERIESLYSTTVGQKTVEKHDFGPTSREFGLKLIILFGSQAKGTANANSDVDIAILPEKELSLEDQYSLGGLIGKVFGKNADKTEIIDLNRASPLLAKEIMNSGKLIFGKIDDLNRYKLAAWRQFIDTARLRRLRSLRLQTSLIAN